VLPPGSLDEEGTMSAKIETAHVGTYPISERRQVARVSVSALLVALAAIAVLGFLTRPGTTSPARACMARVGCGEVQENGLNQDAIETSFWAAGAGAASTTWFWWALEPVSPALEHFRHPSVRAADLSWALEPVSPALEHFLHPWVTAADLSWALEPVSPALEHFLHPIVGTP
jgi:hypothetical protein